MRLILCFIGLVLILLSTHLYVYTRGMADGEARYKRGTKMYLALKSAYKMGYSDAKSGLPEDWDGD